MCTHRQSKVPRPNIELRVVLSLEVVPMHDCRPVNHVCGRLRAVDYSSQTSHTGPRTDCVFSSPQLNTVVSRRRRLHSKPNERTARVIGRRRTTLGVRAARRRSRTASGSTLQWVPTPSGATARRGVQRKRGSNFELPLPFSRFFHSLSRDVKRRAWTVVHTRRSPPSFGHWLCTGTLCNKCDVYTVARGLRET